MYRTLRFCALAAALAVPLAPALAKDADTYAALHGSEPALADGQGRVYFYREGGIVGAAVQPLVYVDGAEAGRSKPGDYFYVDLPAGDHKVSTDTEKEEAIQITVVGGQTMFVKTRVTMGLFVGHVIPSVVENATAESEIKDCDFHPRNPPAPVAVSTPGPAPTPEAAPAAAAPASTPAPDATTTPAAGASN